MNLFEQKKKNDMKINFLKIKISCFENSPAVHNPIAESSVHYFLII